MMISGSQFMIASDFFHLDNRIKEANLNPNEITRFENAAKRWATNEVQVLENGATHIQSEQSYQSRACQLIKCAICCPCESLLICYKTHKTYKRYIPVLHRELDNILEERAALMQPVPSNDIEMTDRF